MKSIKLFFMLWLGVVLMSAGLEDGKCKAVKVSKKASSQMTQKKSAKVPPLFEILFSV
jgi:hypothetical protein